MLMFLNKILTVSALLLIVLSLAVSAQKVAEADTAFDSFAKNLSDVNFKRYGGLPEKEINYWSRNFYPPLKVNLIENGESVERLEKLSTMVFKIHGVTDQCRTNLVKSNLPTVLTWKLTFVTFTTRDLEILSDDEIIALTAHEIGHLYYTDELLRARTSQDHRLERIIELKADLIALMTLKLLKIKSIALLSAINKLIDARSQDKIESFQPGSPLLEDRQAVSRKFSERYDSATLNNPF